MNKKVFITGASGNLGKASIEKFLGSGYDVIAAVSPKGLGFDVEGNVSTYLTDLTDEKNVNDVIQKVILEHKKIDVALLLVGGFAVGGLKETDGTSIKKMFSLNFETAYNAARPIFLHMQKEEIRGRIILVGARPALAAGDGKDLIAYALSKSLIFKLAEYLNAEGASQDIITSVIVPGAIDTPMNRKNSPSADFSKWVTPEAIADTIAFITSSEAAALREPIVKIYGQS